MMEYKGYHAEIVFDHDTHALCGWLYGISDLVTFESDTSAGIIEEFHNAVDDYLEFCKESGTEPKRELNLHRSFELKPELYKSLSAVAKNSGESLNSLIEKILSNYIAKTA